jgi:hypothetical protein
MRSSNLLCIGAFALMLSACAGTTVSRIEYPGIDQLPSLPADKNDNDATGIRYYESAPFLLVYSDGKGGLVSQLLYLPDLTQKRVINPYAYLAANNSTLTFDKGVLTQGKTVVDETIVPKSLIGVLEQAAAASIGRSFNAAGAEPPTQLPPPQLFKIVLEKGRSRLVGGPGEDSRGAIRQIDVTISGDKKPAPADKAASGAK